MDETVPVVPVPPGVIARARLLARLDAARTHRLTTIVADAGFGKSVLLEQWLNGAGAAGAVVVRPAGRDLSAVAGPLCAAVTRHSAEEGSRLQLVVEAGGADGTDRPVALAGMVCASLESLPNLDLLLVIDDAHGLEPAATRFVEGLCRQAPVSTHLVLVSRVALPFAVERMQADVLSLTGTELGLDRAETAEVLAAELGDDRHTDAVRRLTGGWPAAVRVVAAALALRPRHAWEAELARMQLQGANVFAAVAQDALGAESPQVRRFIQVVAPYDGFTVDLAEFLGCPDAAGTLAGLAARGIVVRLDFERVQLYAFPRLLREFLRTWLPLEPDERSALVRRAAAWFEANGQFEAALRCAVDQQDGAWVARLLRERGLALVAAGRWRRVATALELVGDQERDAAVEQVAGAVHEQRGDVEAAFACYRRAVGDRNPINPWLASRLGFLHYQRGELEHALEVFERGGPQDSADYARLLAWKATVHWARGRADQGLEVAVPALALAERLDDAAALSAAHTALAMLAAHEGDRRANREHYERALEQAERAGDLVQVVRIRNNRGSRLLEEGELEASLVELEIAIELAGAGGLRHYQSLALANRGEVRFHLGQYDAALADLEAARDLERAAGSLGISFALTQLGHIYRHRGDFTLSQLAYEEAVTAARTAGDVGLLVQALSGLAQLLAETEWERAKALADEALAHESGLSHVAALLAAAVVALAGNDRQQAQRFASVAAGEARARRDRIGLAEALRQLARADPQPVEDDRRLTEAAELLDDVGAPLWKARIRLEQARRMPLGQGRQVVAEVELLARSLGARGLAEQAAGLGGALDLESGAARVELATLGGFRVRRGGKALGIADWPDEAARSVLKRLAARPSLSWSRAAMSRSIWPAGAPDEALEKAVSQARVALDPVGRLAEDFFVVLDAEVVALVPEHVEVDVHGFLAESAALDDIAQLQRAESRYCGDFLEEHPGEPWADRLREEARSRYVQVARALAEDSARAGEHEAAARYSRRILERDPYDEGAHLALVAALTELGRPGEARRCYGLYVQRLEELGLEAVPWGQIVPQTRPATAS
ncbi:MAG: transcriptional activator domain protein [Frankiales bacterium]|nr:transcriptional activator domain protein [Frankiales bacterium]